MSGPRRVVVLHNTDFDAELAAAGLDASSVKNAAEAVRDGLRAAGMSAELMGLHGLELLEVARALTAEKPDVVFNLCESLAGEARHEPALPAVLDLHGIAYTGTDGIGLALALFKHRTKDVLRGRGVSTPPHLLIRSAAELERLRTDGGLDRLDYPWFLKLASEDASVGIIADNVARDAGGLVRRARALFEEFRSPLLAERFVDGREVNVSLLGWGDEVEVMPVHEIDFSSMPAGRPHIVSYAAKWDEAHVDYAGTKPVPMRASDELLAAIRRTARAAWDAVGLRDYGRIDLRVDAAGTPWVIDVNPNCDLSPDAGAARAAKAAGLDYPQFVAKIATSAWRRARGGGAVAAAAGG